jgi:lysyl-tRNA synthetase class 2
MEIGDIISATGYPFYTKTGELTIHVSSLDILTKAILPFPEKWNGLEDKETRYRKRYLDMISNAETTSVLIQRSRIISDIRSYMTNNSYLEVETPILNAIPGGANARPFTTYHNALDVQRFLRIAPELYLKRLVVGGMDRVFEIGKNFRNEGIDATHNPEFTSMEFYCAYQDYEYLMNMIEDMVTQLFNTYRNSEDNMTIEYGKHSVDFSNWRKISYRNSLIEIGGISKEIVDDREAIIKFLKGHSVIVNETLSLGHLWEKLFDEFVEDKLSNPTFITEYPVEISPLARRHDTNPMITERFELFMAGREIANGFNELNDPIDQYQRFQLQVESKGIDDEAMHMDTDFVEALMYAMPPTSGAGIGIDRLVMILTNQSSIRDVIAFPTMR